VPRSLIFVDCCTTSRGVGGFSEALCPLPARLSSRLTPPARLGTGITDRDDGGERRRHGRGARRSMEGRPKMEGRRGEEDDSQVTVFRRESRSRSRW
jgi:hypothetical protein